MFCGIFLEYAPIMRDPHLPIYDNPECAVTSLGFEDVSSFACFLGYDYEELYGERDISAFGEEVRNRLSVSE